MQTEIPTISPEQLYGHRPALLDVRTQAEYRAGHIPEATLLPIEELNAEDIARNFNQPNV